MNRYSHFVVTYSPQEFRDWQKRNPHARAKRIGSIGDTLGLRIAKAQKVIITPRAYHLKDFPEISRGLTAAIK